jgi:TonB family protein
MMCAQKNQHRGLITMTRRRCMRFAFTFIAAASSIFALARALVPAASGQNAASQNAASQDIALPPFRGTLKDDYYPADARRHYQQGRALVEFTVDARGVPADVVVVNAEPEREFSDAARLLARNLRYQVPTGWQQSASAHRFRLGVRFQVIDCINFSHCESNAHNPPADYDAADRTYVLSTQKRVVILLPAAAPIAAPPTASPPIAPATPLAPAPKVTPSAASPPVPSEEPVYPPG